MSRRIQCGQVLVLTAGAYDDYGVSFISKAITDFDLTEVAIEYRGAIGDEALKGEAFGEFLKRRGLVELLDYEEVHVASYGKMDKILYCRHEHKTFHLFANFEPEHKPLGSMAELCDYCKTVFPETARPATEAEYFEIYPHMRNPQTGHRYTDDEYRAARPDLFANQQSG